MSCLKFAAVYSDYEILLILTLSYVA